MLGPLATAQWVAILSVAGGVGYIVWRHRRAGSPPEVPGEPVIEEETPETALE
jgi:hypothetical protein